LNNSLAAVLFVAILLMGLSAGWIGGNVNLSGSMVATQTTNSRLPVEVTGKVVNLDIIADWGGSTYDAFVVSSYTNGTVPKPATNATGPGANDNNITVQAGTTVTFIITNLDTAVLVNFTGPVSTDFIVYNNTESGQVASHYSAGQSISNLPISHTFTIQNLNIHIPIPPDTVVTFTYTFTTPGVYKFFCQTPCGPGMEIAGYMIGYLIVTRLE
jgi:plastocyanin